MIESVQVTYPNGVVHHIHAEQLNHETLMEIFNCAGVRRESQRRELARDLMGDITFGSQSVIRYDTPMGDILVARRTTPIDVCWDVPKPTWVDKAGLRPLVNWTHRHMTSLAVGLGLTALATYLHILALVEGW